jgi:phosphatidylserine/phosphatidylglycerophosphate/cardiolipin synthase-like enzyme
MNATIPEEAIVDAVLSDALSAAALISHLSNCKLLAASSGLLDDFAREQGITSQKLDLLLETLIETGIVCQAGHDYVLAISVTDAARYAAVLRGAAYAQYRQRDSNQIEITLSPPGHPSRLMEILPRHGFSWTHLYNTKDSLIELASQAEKRLVVITPFLDPEGMQWITQLFEGKRDKPLERIMIVRARDQAEISVLTSVKDWLAQNSVTVLSYAVVHDSALRSPMLETFHAKIILADRDKAYIGSANMTRWSRDFSMECGVILRGPAVKPVATLVDAIVQIGNHWIPGDSSKC